MGILSSRISLSTETSYPLGSSGTITIWATTRNIEFLAPEALGRSTAFLPQSDM